jgi:hypothetical protein
VRFPLSPYPFVGKKCSSDIVHSVCRLAAYLKKDFILFAHMKIIVADPDYFFTGTESDLDLIKF